MSRRKNQSNTTTEEGTTMTATPETESVIEPVDDEQLPETDEVDLDVEDVDDEVEDTEGDDGQTQSTKKDKEPAKPKRGDLPEGLVTPIQFAKVLGERGLHTDRDGNVVTDVKPQMVYSYMKNSPKDDRLEPHTITDSNGVERSVLNLDEALAWWERKNERAAQRKANAKAKADKAAAKAQTSKQAAEETGEIATGQDEAPAEEAE
jgi:hypothetical protein